MLARASSDFEVQALCHSIGVFGGAVSSPFNRQRALHDRSRSYSGTRIQKIDKSTRDSARTTGCGILAALVPWHAGQHHPHSASVRDPREDETRADKRRKSDECGMNKPGENRAEQDE